MRGPNKNKGASVKYAEFFHMCCKYAEYFQHVFKHAKFFQHIWFFNTIIMINK